MGRQRATCGSKARESDEGFACELLMDYLTQHCGGAIQWEVNCDDPPDIIATLAGGIQWGAEVTRAYQQVPLPGKEELGSTEAVVAALDRWGAAVGDRAAEICIRDYVLHLGPGPLRLQGGGTELFGKKWMKESEKATREHIVSGKTSPLRLPGLWLKAGETGKRWKVYVSPGGSVHTREAATSMLRRALLGKARDVPDWKGNFDQRWLLVTNNYPFADDINEVRSIVGRLAQCHRELRRIDGILWSGMTDPGLVKIWQRRDSRVMLGNPTGAKFAGPSRCVPASMERV